MAEAALIIVPAVISAFASIQEGRSIADAEDMRQQQFARQQETAGLQMRDELNERRREIAAQLGEQAAMGAQSGFDPFAAGSSFLAIREETERVGKVDQERIRLIGLNNMRDQNDAILQSQLVADSARTASYLNAASTLVGAGGKAYGLRGSAPPSGGGGFTGRAAHSGKV